MWRLFFAVLVFLSNLSCGITAFGRNLILVEDDDKAQISCNIALIHKYFHSGEPLSGSVLHVSLTSATVHTQKILLQAMHQAENFPWSVVVRDPRQPMPQTAPLYEKPQCYFIVVENLEDDDFDDMFEDWRNIVNYNPLAQFIVFLASVEETDEEMTELMTEVLLGFLNKKLFNVNVISQNDETGFYYGKSVFPFHPDNNCGTRVISIETLDICDYQEGPKKDEGGDGEYDEDSGGEEDDDDDDEEEGGEEDSNQEGENRSDDSNTSKEASRGGAESDENTKQDDKENNGNESKTTSNGEDEDERNNDDKSEEQNNNNGDDETTTNPDNEENDKGEAETRPEDEVLEQSEEIERNSDEDEPRPQNPPDDGDPPESAERIVDSIERSMEELNVIEDQKNYYYEDENDRIDPEDKDDDDDGMTPADSADPVKNLTTTGHELDYPTLGIEDRFPQIGGGVTSTEHRTSNSTYFPRLYIEEVFRALFFDKFPKDLSGCPLVAAYRPWEPYIFREATESDDEYETDVTDSGVNDSYSYSDSDDEDRGVRLNGIEYKLVQTIAERLHINVEMETENPNLYLLFQRLIDGDVEMVVGGVDEDPSISQYVSSTIPYHQDDLTWCVAKAKKNHNIFNFLETFTVITWILTLAFIVVTAFSISLIEIVLHRHHMQGFFTAAVRIFGIVLSQSIHLKLRSAAIKIAFATSFFMGFLFSNIYQSVLVSTLTTPKSSYQISHIREIYEHRMDILGSAENVRHFNKEGEVFKYLREKFQMCYNIEECLNRAAQEENIAVAVSRLHSFYNPRIRRDQLYCFDRNDNLYIYLVTILLPKNHHLLHKINPVIQAIIESGHLSKWARDLDMRRMIKEEINRAHEEPFKSLTITEIGGIFVFAGFLMLQATVCLIIERWVYVMVRRKKTRLKIIKWLHRKFI